MSEIAGCAASTVEQFDNRIWIVDAALTYMLSVSPALSEDVLVPRPHVTISPTAARLFVRLVVVDFVAVAVVATSEELDALMKTIGVPAPIETRPLNVPDVALSAPIEKFEGLSMPLWKLVVPRTLSSLPTPSDPITEAPEVVSGMVSPLPLNALPGVALRYTVFQVMG